MTHGGKREGAGRKPSQWGELIRCDVRLTPQMIEYCRRVGNGDLSEGIRRVLASAILPDESESCGAGDQSVSQVSEA